MAANLRHTIRSVDDAEHCARRRLPRALVQRVEGGAGRGLTAAANAAVFDEVQFRPRAGVWNSVRSLSTTVLGHRISLPVLTAPVTNLRVFHRDGEVGVARAAGEAGTIACIGAFSGYPIEEITTAAAGALFFQLYFLGGRSAAEALIARVRDAGVAALVVTLDSPTWMRRERPHRERVEDLNGNRRSMLRFLPQALVRPGWAAGFVRDGLRVEAPMALRADGRLMPMREAAGTLARQPPTFEDLGWIQEAFGGPVIVKGILSAEDARRAVAEGAAAVVVSNHGGRQLDGVPATLDALPEVADAIGGRVEVYLDGGIRRGTDVDKALALGARAVLAGRGPMFGLAVAGEDGVRHVLELLRDELTLALCLLGCTSPDELSRVHVQRSVT